MRATAIVPACILLACLGTGARAQAVPPPRQVQGAVLSDHVYSLAIPGSGILVTSPPTGGEWKAPAGYQVVGALGNDKNGFQGAIYQSGSSQYMVVYRGTEGPKDYTADAGIAGLGSGFESQLSDARRLTDYAVQQYGRDNVTIAGHSLGGAIAQAESARTGLAAETYNAPGMLGYIREHYPDARVELITNHDRADDLVSKIGEQPGYQRIYRTTFGKYADVVPPNGLDIDPSTAMALASIGADHSSAGFARLMSEGEMPIDEPTLRSLDGTRTIVDQWGDGGATVRRKEFEAVARQSADESRAKAAAAAAAATLSPDPPAPDPFMGMLSTLVSIQAAKAGGTPDGSASKASAAGCPKKVFKTPDGCHPGHDEKAHPGGCYCG